MLANQLQFHLFTYFYYLNTLFLTYLCLKLQPTADELTSPLFTLLGMGIYVLRQWCHVV